MTLWYNFVTDLGFTGPDKGKGGKYSDPAARLQGQSAARLFRRTPRDVQRLGSLALLPLTAIRNRAWIS